jgi:hypothetical protein
MRKLTQATCLGLIFVFVLSTLSATPQATAEPFVAKPAVPQFSIQYVDYSYDIPESYSTDPYTGQQIRNPSQHIGDVRIEGKIKNQAFTRYQMQDPNGTDTLDIDFYYNVRSKGHFGTEWSEIYGYHNKNCPGQNYGAEYTSFTIYLQEFPEGTKVDYQVKAMIGYQTTEWIGPWPQPVIIGEESDWSSTLTLVFTKNETESISFASNIDNTPYPPLPTPEPTPTATAVPVTSVPSQTPEPTNNQGFMWPSLDWREVAIVVLAVAIGVLAVTLVDTRRRLRRKEK